ncbi:MAG TPA: hypothetical protein PK208_14770, partial [Fibrobacteria bacterium]|nr:hypothetical protein [Fibrobacteria bacterium]
MPLTTLARGLSSLTAKLPLAADGKSQDKEAVFRSLDLNGPLAVVTATAIDTQGLGAGVRVEWKWLEPGTAKTVKLSLTKGDARHERVVQIPAGVTSVDVPWADPSWRLWPVDRDLPYLRDGQEYRVELIGVDEKGNPGGGSALVNVPSSKYELRITTLNLLEVPRPVGRICIEGRSGWKDCADYDSYGGDQLTTTRIMDVKRDVYSVTLEDDRYQPEILDVMPGSRILGSSVFEHSPDYPVYEQSMDTAPDMKLFLHPRNFLAQDGASLEQEITTGDLVFRFERNRFPGGILDTILLGLTEMVDGVSRPVDIRIPVTEYDESTTPVDLESWTVRRTLDQLKTGNGVTLFSGATHRSIRYLGATARFSNTRTLERIVKLRDSVIYHASGVPTAWHVLDPDGPSVVDDSRRSITSGGEAGWALDVPSSHGARAVMTLCRQDDDGTEVCRDSSVVPTVRRLGFRPTVAGAYSVPGNVNFQEGVAGGSVFVPAGQASAASQWNLFSDAAGEYDLWVDWSTDDFSEDFAASLDSGKNWVLQNSLTIEGWNRIGTLDLRKGWNALAIRASQGAVINGVLLQKIGTKKPILLSSTLALSHAPIPSYVSASLDRDRIYKSTLKVRDAYGLVSQTVSTFPVQPDGLFGDIVLEQEPITGDLLIKAGQTRFVPTPGGFQIRLAPGTPAIVPELDSSDRLTIRIPRAKIGPDVVAGSGVSKAGPLDSIRILTTKPVTYHWTTRDCWHGGVLGGWGCDTRHHQETRIEPDSIRLNWTGFVPWKSAHDLRPLPKPVVSVAYAGLDSIRLKIAGLDDSSGQTRQTMAGTVRVEWTPGSHCASATTVEVPFRQVFVVDESGSVLLRPSLSSASASRNGGWADTTPGAPRLRHQWLDNTNGGGFFPMMLEPIPQPQDRPWIAFAIRNPQANPFVAKLWTLPGDYVGLRRQRFEYRLAPLGTTDPSVPAWKSGQGYSDVWHGQTDDLILQPGLQELQIRMVDPGVTFRAIGLREASLGSPSVDFNSIPRTGSEGMDEVFVSAPALASGTLHGFRIVATDRVGNTSTDSVTVATLASNTKLPTVGIALSPWDGSGWVTGDVATVSLIPDGRFTLPEDAQIKAWLRHRDGATGALTSDSSEVAVVRDANGDWTATLSGLGARGQTLDDFENGERTVLVAWVQTATDRGNRTGLDFAVLSDTRPGLVTGTFLDGPVGSGLTFRVKEAWQKQPGSTTYYADLELPAFKVQEDDTAVNHLVLRGAKVAFATEGTSLRLTNVVGGRLAATHCKLVGTTESQCHDVARMPWTLGRWAGFLEMESVKPEISGTSDWRLEVQNAELIDDAGRPSRNSEPFYLADAGIVVSDEPAYLGKANFSKDRFWFANVVAANQQEEAFGIEACMTVIRRSASGLEFETMGCDTETGPFLTFPLNIQTDGPWSVVGAAFDSLKDPYKLTWTPGTGSGTKWIEGVPESRGAISIPSAPVTVTKSALRDARGASLWGYDVLSYKFGQTGVTDLVFDLVLPDTKLSPAQDGVAQRVKSFTGMSIVSDATVMQGAPVLRGTGVSTDPVQLRLGSSLRLDDVVSWTYARQEGVGWVLTPFAGASAPVYLSKEQDAGWKYTRIGGLDQADDRFRFPFETLEIGPGTYVSASSSQDVVVSTGGATVTARLAVDPNDDELRIVANSPSVTLDKFFTEKGTANFASATVTDPELRLDPEFGMADIEGVGNLGTSEQAANKQVWIGGLPVVNAIPSGRFQILANRGRVFVRLFRPQMVLHDLVSGALPSAPSAEVQTAVFTTDRMPVAVGAQLDVPDNWKEFQIPGSIGSLQLDKMYLEATSDYDAESKIWTPGLRLQTPTVVKLGDAFQKMGLDGYRLPLKSVTMGLRAKLGGAFTSNMKMDDLDWDVEFETAPIGFALDLELTRERLRTLVSGSYNKAADKTPVLVKLSTQGWPVYAKYKQRALELSLQNWEIELTDSFPIQAMRNTSFHLENLTVNVGANGDWDVTTFDASGTKEFPQGISITSDVELLGTAQNPVSVTVAKGTGKSPVFSLQASSVRLGNDTYQLVCNGKPSSITLSLDGDFIGKVCVESNKRINLYPLNQPDADVYVTGPGETETDPYQVELFVTNGEFGMTLKKARLRSKPMAPVFPSGVDALVTGSLWIKDGSIRVRKAMAIAALGADSKGWSSGPMGPFELNIPDLRFFYNTVPADGIVETTDPKAPGGKKLTDYAEGEDYTNKIAILLHPTIKMKAGSCTSEGQAKVGFVNDMESDKSVALDWGFRVKDFACELGGLDVLVQGLELGEQSGELTVSTRVLQVSIPEKAGNLLAVDQDENASEQAQFEPSSELGWSEKLKGKGLRVEGLRYANKTLDVDAVKPIGFGDLDNLALEIPGIGVTVISRLDVMPLFDLDRPGVAFDNVRLALPKAMGGDTLNTNFSLLFNGKSPYVHVRGSMKELPLRIRGIQLTDDVGLNGAEMLIKFTEKLNGESGWSFEGTASLNMQGGLGKLDAELAVEKPGDCKVGVCKAVVSLRLKDGARYPLGTTGLYMAGLKGAFYDGIYSPPCAKKCTGREMPNGMKVELAIYLEAESPSVLKGTTGVWVQLNRINFGVYGDLLIMEGRADADACAAVFAGGKQFHGEVNVRLQAALSVKGGFVIDIWSDRRGKNMAAEASASVGLERGAIIKSRWFKFPRSMRWFGPFVTRFGRFDDGSNGVTTGIRALGKTWGAGFVNGGFRLGNVGKYKLAKPPSGDGLFLAGSEYRIIPLGLDLQGGEVVSVNVGAAEGVDWRGAQIQLVEPNTTSDERGNTSMSTDNLTLVAGMDDRTMAL